MFGTIWHTLFLNPIYNALVYFIDAIPGGDVGIAIILTVIIVKVLLLPLSIKAAKTQKVMREIEPKLKDIKERITDPQEQARATMDLYREAGINPFASILLLFVQIPIVIALYFAVAGGGGVPLPGINTSLLYGFVPVPATVSMLFLGILDITQKSLLLAIFAGALQFLQSHFMFPALPPRDPKAPASMKDDFGRSMQMQMKYFLPVFIGIIAYTTSAAIALYFVISSITTLAQELLFVRKHKI
jgi:YidC/Oxa1 family membrane protein insertase